METCINAKMPGFAFYNELDSEKPKGIDTSASLVASYWIYSASMQMYNTTVCPNNATIDSVRKCCSDQFAKVFVFHNPFNDLQDSADRYDAFCKASQNCTKQLSAGCVQNFSNSIAVVKECLRKQYETEKIKKELANKFIACMKKSSADNQSSYFTEPKMVEFQAQMCISKWVEALPEHPETNCSKNSFWDQFKPQPIGINSYIAPRPGPGPISGPASSGVANPFHGTPPQPAVQPLVPNQTAGGASQSAAPNVALPAPPPPPPGKAANPPPPPPDKAANPPPPPPGKAANPPPPPTAGKEAHPSPTPPAAVTGTPPNVTPAHVGTTAHSAGRRRRSIKL
jgi:hypothetical protein